MPAGKTKKVISDEKQARRPAITPEAREKQLISLAYDEAERQLRDHTASSQVMVHFLRLATLKEQKEIEKIELEKQLMAAKKEALQSEQRSEELANKALQAFSRYAGKGGSFND